MAYQVKEIYHSIQGEGAQTGRAAVLCRFAGCNLWSGREEDREDAECVFCDTDFVGTDGPGGGVFEAAADVATAVAHCWAEGKAGSAGTKPLVICTGGEPLLQLDDALIGALHDAGFEVAVESNGTLPAPQGIDWLTVSPKSAADDPALVQRSGDELKLVFPQPGVEPEDFAALDFTHFYLQPMDGPDKQRNTALVLDYCRRHPRWRVSLQTHKILGVA
ncbi:MAG: 7-carboxy-7-deazaguanine synthase [Alphaproteobacteria bacterium]|nr:7-carboxy-7-deazaguanine synthase [Alphaproteobacteria bacterium]